ncbi:Zn-dependent oxidoreductase, NADPH:quinone reductase [Burkholderiales bacterium JOSHI_001]|nr:Zn-dependent oxidoreductase, NADPH:quinone reductase [Burkholderiales bacterium JOSHI_001]
MQGWLCENPTGVESLQWKEWPTPEPAAGELRIAVRAASLNFPDLLTVANKYQVKPPMPFVPGSEYAGVVEAVGPGVTQVAVGDRVAALGAWGGFGTHAIAPANRVMKLPEAMPFEDGAAFAFTYGTSHHALMDRGELKAGQTVLVLGAAGGVGTAAVQIAKAAGARVIAGVSSDDKAALVQRIGADLAINYTRENLRDALKAATNGQGVDIVYDPVGGDLAEPAFRSIAWRGRYLVIGFALGSIPALPLNLALLKGASIVGVFWGDFARREPARYAQGIGELLAWYAQGKVKPVIHQVLPMARVLDAYALMGQRQVMGKVVLTNA